LKKRILLTGGAGAVGLETLKELIRRKDLYETIILAKNSKKHHKLLKKYEDRVRVFYGDIRDKKTTDAISKNIDFVIHLAAVIPPLADAEPRLTEEVNLGGTINLIRSIEKFSPKAFFLYSSSVAVYGDRLKNPWIKVGDKIKASPGDEYAKTKIQAEKEIENSHLNWSIFRLTAIMHPRQKFDPLMFHMPLETKIEICTTRDTAYAIVQAIENTIKLNKKTFNLSGGEKCRVIYRNFLGTCLSNSGLGIDAFPDTAFAKADFHCGYFKDSQELNQILNFQKDSIDDFYLQFKKELGIAKPILASIFRPLIIRYFLRKSDPYRRFA
jgi:nucleoside-diphosphate-sugar epimerase